MVKSFHHILFLFRREEEKEEGLDVIDPESSTGTRKSDLVGWYLGEIQEEIESEEELVEKKVMVEKIIDRLVNQDQVNILNQSILISIHSFSFRIHEFFVFVSDHGSYLISIKMIKSCNRVKIRITERLPSLSSNPSRC